MTKATVTTTAKAMATMAIPTKTMDTAMIVAKTEAERLRLQLQ